jgi:hypothetical protein
MRTPGKAAMQLLSLQHDIKTQGLPPSGSTVLTHYVYETTDPQQPSLLLLHTLNKLGNINHHLKQGIKVTH